MRNAASTLLTAVTDIKGRALDARNSYLLELYLANSFMLACVPFERSIRISELNHLTKINRQETRYSSVGFVLINMPEFV